MRGQELTPKQKRFVQEYLVDLNATQAAIRAGYSQKTANQQGSRLLANVKVLTAITEAQGKRALRMQISQDDVLHELKRIGFSNMGNYVGKSGPKDVSTLDEEEMAAVQEVLYGDDGKVSKIKLLDKLAALVNIGKHLGMFKETRILENPDGSEIDGDNQITINFVKVGVNGR